MREESVRAGANIIPMAASNKTNSVAFSPQANYTDRKPAAAGEVAAKYSG
jgi:hypothetical protein